MLGLQDYNGWSLARSDGVLHKRNSVSTTEIYSFPFIKPFFKTVPINVT